MQSKDSIKNILEYFAENVNKCSETAYEEAIEDHSFTSDNCFINRHFCSALAYYIGTKGIPIKLRSIGGWDPIVTIVSDNNKTLQRYLKYLMKAFWYKFQGNSIHSKFPIFI